MATVQRFSQWRWLALPGLLSFAAIGGCPGNSGPVGQHMVEEVHKLATEIRDKVDTVRDGQGQLIARQNDLEAKTQAQIGMAAQYVDNATYANAQNMPANPYTQVTGGELALAAQVLGPPPEDRRAEVIEKLQLALSGTEKDLEELQARYATATKEALQAKADRDAALQSVGAVQQNLVQKTAELQTTATKLSSAEERANLEAAAAKDAAEAKRKAEAAQARLHIAYSFMALGGLLIVAALVATGLRVRGVLAVGLASGGALLLLGWVITALEEWLHLWWFQIALGAGLLSALVLVVLLIVRACRTRWAADLDARIGQGTIAALQEAKNDDAKQGTTTFAAVKPYLQDWFVDDDGKPDTALAKEIDRRLVALNLMNPAGAEPSVVNRLRAAAAHGKNAKTKKTGKAGDGNAAGTSVANVG
jgi:hypothetical protein